MAKYALLVWLCSFCAFAQPAASSDIPSLKPADLAPWYWLKKLNGQDPLLMSAKAISDFNAKVIAAVPERVALASLPNAISGKEVKKAITAISHTSERYLASGKALDWPPYLASRNLAAIKASQPLRFALVVRRTAMRTFPTTTRVFKKDLNTDLDRFQETGLFPGQALAIMATSRDGKWYFAQSRNYRAWVQAADVAIGSRQDVLAYGQKTPFLMTTGARVETVFNPVEPRVSQRKFDMGLRLPLAAFKGHDLYGQNPYSGYVVTLPVRNRDGSLAFKPALIARGQDVHLGYLPYTQGNLIRQAFKFLGERYGWGHDFDGRDCTGFVGEVYRSFGFLLPRNSGEQGYGQFGLNHRFGKGQVSQKLAVLKKAPVGSLIYLPGHVAMLLGWQDGKPWIIHDVAGLAYLKDGKLYRGVLNGVSVTPLLPLMLSPSTSYLEASYNIKTLQ